MNNAFNKTFKKYVFGVIKKKGTKNMTHTDL